MKTATQLLSALLTKLPLETFDHPETDDEWERSPLASLPDAELIAAAIATITPPKIARPSSFVLHAPLELLARAALLPYVATEAYSQARRQIAAVAVRYAHAGPAIDDPKITHTNTDTALSALIGSLNEGDADGVDSALLFLLPRVPLLDLRRALIDEITPCLGAAGHAPILLAALAATSTRNVGPHASGLLRAPLRTLASSADLRLTWFQTGSPSATSINEATLFDRLVAPPRVTSPSTSIAPMMLAVERSGDAARLLQEPIRELSAQNAAQILLRVAAYSMLQDDPAQAPYGWTHCLTLPQGLLRNADVSKKHHALIAVAATHVLASRAALGKVTINANPPLPTSHTDLNEADPGTAASIAFHTIHANPAQRKEIITTLATEAALHHDAHLVKYTLACFEAAAKDPAAAPLFMAAAAYLGAWWKHQKRS
jgi:hypothetical protein